MSRRHVPDHKAKVARSKARRSILDAANGHRLKVDPYARPWGIRRIQQAVCIVRRNRLVKPHVLSVAGYNATGQ